MSMHHFIVGFSPRPRHPHLGAAQGCLLFPRRVKGVEVGWSVLDAGNPPHVGKLTGVVVYIIPPPRTPLHPPARLCSAPFALQTRSVNLSQLDTLAFSRFLLRSSLDIMKVLIQLAFAATAIATAIPKAVSDASPLGLVKRAVSPDGTCGVLYSGNGNG